MHRSKLGNTDNLKLPDKGQIQNMILESKSEVLDEVNLKEMPFYVQNYTGYSLIFHLKYNEYSANFYVPNLKTVGLPYPYNINNELLKGGADRIGDFNYWIFLLGNNQEFLKCIYRGSEVIGRDDDEYIKVPKDFTATRSKEGLNTLAKFVKVEYEEEKAKIDKKYLRTDLDAVDSIHQQDENYQTVDYYKKFKDDKGNWKNWSKGDITDQDDEV